MAVPDISRTYELLRRFMQQLRTDGACWAPSGAPWSLNGAPEDNSDSDGSPQGGLLGRLQALDAARGYQGSAVNDDHVQSTPTDPNFRQLSRVPSIVPAEGDSSVSQPASGSPGLPSRQPVAPPWMPVPPAKDAEDDSDILEMLKRRYSGGSGRGGGRRGGGRGPGGGDKTDKCDAMRIGEEGLCYGWQDDVVHPHHYSGCMERAEERWAKCYQTGEIPDWPRPWRPGNDDYPGDEEVWINEGR